MVGTDHPFIAHQLTAAPAIVRAAAERRGMSDGQAQKVLRSNAMDLLGLSPSAATASSTRGQVVDNGLPSGP